MKNFTLIACLTLGLISCSNTGYEKKIPGSWCEPIPGRAQDVQGIKFQKDGKASSINMATLQYKSWKINGKHSFWKEKVPATVKPYIFQTP